MAILPVAVNLGASTPTSKRYFKIMPKVNTGTPTTFDIGTTNCCTTIPPCCEATATTGYTTGTGGTGPGGGNIKAYITIIVSGLRDSDTWSGMGNGIHKLCIKNAIHEKKIYRQNKISNYTNITSTSTVGKISYNYKRKYSYKYVTDIYSMKSYYKGTGSIHVLHRLRDRKFRKKNFINIIRDTQFIPTVTFIPPLTSRSREYNKQVYSWRRTYKDIQHIVGVGTKRRARMSYNHLYTNHVKSIDYYYVNDNGPGTCPLYHKTTTDNELRRKSDTLVPDSPPKIRGQNLASFIDASTQNVPSTFSFDQDLDMLHLSGGYIFNITVQTGSFTKAITTTTKTFTQATTMPIPCIINYPNNDVCGLDWNFAKEKLTYGTANLGSSRTTINYQTDYTNYCTGATYTTPSRAKHTFDKTEIKTNFYI
jgi:hypothetical protein